MKKKIVLSLLMVLTALSLCSRNEATTTTNIEDNESEQTLFERHKLDHYYSILVDGETGVCYLEYMGPKMYNITVMLNSDGTPRIWKEEEK